MDALEVAILDVSFVAPAAPTGFHGSHLFLSSLDLFWREYLYNRRVLFYSLPDRQQHHDFICTLRSSLSQVLVSFYPAAGRLAPPASGPNYGRVSILCNDAGVEFVEASVDADLCSLEDLDFPPGKLLNRLARWENHSMNDIYNMPLLSIQVTKLSCGSVAVGYAHSHVLADGHSMWHFMNSWAECARKQPISTPPVHTRTLLKVEKPSETLAHFDFPPTEFTLSEGHNGLDVTAISSMHLVEKVYHCSGEMIKRLKEKAMMDYEGTSVRFTSYEVLCAHMWKCITKARELRPDEAVRFGVVANMRRRLKEPLPSGYFGNAVIFISSCARVRQVLEEGLGETSMRIKQAAKECSEETMWGIMHWLELNGNSFGDKMKSFKGAVVKAVSSPQFPVYDVDFGWGRPQAVRAAKVRGDGEMVLFPSRPSPVPQQHVHDSNGGVDICLPLSPQAAMNLINCLACH